MKILDTKGKAVGNLTLPDEIFKVKVNPQLMAQAIRVYLANQRQGTSKVKSRGEIKGSTRKIYRQKGTGRARHGDRYAPIFVGGGVAHGPRGNQNVKLTISKKMRKLALFSVLSKKVKNDEILIVQGLGKLDAKTKIMNATLKIMVEKAEYKPGRISLILSDNQDSIRRATRNIKFVNILSANKLNAYETLNGGLLIFEKDAFDQFKDTFLGSKKEKKDVKDIENDKKIIKEPTKVKTITADKKKAVKEKKKAPKNQVKGK